ncbi:MAG: hypothetical protein ABJC04_10285, partial [Verrucomicrobiota bacterium]
GESGQNNFFHIDFWVIDFVVKIEIGVGVCDEDTELVKRFKKNFNYFSRRGIAMANSHFIKNFAFPARRRAIGSFPLTRQIASLFFAPCLYGETHCQ